MTPDLWPSIPVDMDLIEILWKQDEDLGVSRDTFDYQAASESSIKEAVKAANFNSTEVPEGEPPEVHEDSNPWEGFQYSIDSETGEHILEGSTQEERKCEERVDSGCFLLDEEEDHGAIFAELERIFQGQPLQSTLSSESSTGPRVNKTAASSSTGTTELLDNEVKKNNAVYYRRQVSPNRLHAERTPLIKHKRQLPKGQAVLLVRNDCSATQLDIPDLSSNAREIVAVKICPPDQKPFVAVSAYLRPRNISVGPYTWLETHKQASKNLPLLIGGFLGGHAHDIRSPHCNFGTLAKKPNLLALLRAVSVAAADPVGSVELGGGRHSAGHGDVQNSRKLRQRDWRRGKLNKTFICNMSDSNV
ncbi:hypothetical protein HPB51_006367 [Rhipicephalus microplus]|uniref:Uncharacterized protein n=1 Tax=Rhipicephalus microplus TaxID=6941 RepID=A0A9J6DLZ4_RHIMP|nr:hypothetical protein HPB51_006367 [Rhipicephalus microplus]